ncbi:MAG TPA: helix-turn-helix domain-containing protein [Actinocrinis sp.]|uniref:TetR/AcrR family transcriptional regulator n=1 Tax=Actinocrinis sp. TaxID=1920516 RepID=UPI002D6AD028|nr:helix-turn-helix domain-containing protein [Actinocrinis sp.]HZU57725.1 helix-turn-helix domain-containing protein [Actinocrinis sp.]
MGNREDLLEGAKRCLLEKGYRATTARDIAAASGVSLAAIGYHFGSKEALMNQAVYEAVGEWSEGFEEALAAVDPNASALDRIETLWTHMVASFENNKPLWRAQLELIVEFDRNPEMRAFFARIQPEAHLGLSQLFPGADPSSDEKARMQIGKLYHAILIGVMAQYAIDPETAPSGHDLAEALRMIAAHIQTKDAER